jgi:hypothetical protein
LTPPAESEPLGANTLTRGAEEPSRGETRAKRRAQRRAMREAARAQNPAPDTPEGES